MEASLPGQLSMSIHYIIVYENIDVDLSRSILDERVSLLLSELKAYGKLWHDSDKQNTLNA